METLRKDAIKTICPWDKTTHTHTHNGDKHRGSTVFGILWSRVARQAASGKLSVLAKSIYGQHMSEFARLDINKHLSRSLGLPVYYQGTKTMGQ